MIEFRDYLINIATINYIKYKNGQLTINFGLNVLYFNDVEYEEYLSIRLKIRCA